jgi:hypothetical protein
MAFDLPGQFLPASHAREPHNLKLAGQTLRDGKGIATDGTSGTENDDPLGHGVILLAQ